MAVTLEDHICRTMKVAWQEIAGETVLLVSGDEKLMGLNSVAGRIWQLADGSRTVEEIAQTIDTEFEGCGSELRPDTLRFVNKLVGMGLLEACRP
jgi:hypothetical protein